MTKPGPRAAALLAAAFAALALVPAASGHGAPPVRDVDARVLLDDDGLVGYGGCLDGNCPAGAEGLDVLALDVREAWLEGEPAVVFRILVQWEAPAAGASLVLHVEAPGGAKDARIDTADGLAFQSSQFDRLDGPADVGDGHPKALDGWLRYAALGVKAGDALSGLSVSSLRGDAADDVMPGGWFRDGVEVPAVPDEPDPSAVTAEDEPGSYTLSGPAILVTMSANGTADLSHGPAKASLVLVNPLTLPQFANLTFSVPAGVNASLSPRQVLLQPSATRTVELTVSNATLDSVIDVEATTDLGGRATAGLPVKAPFPVLAAANNSTTTDHGPGSKSSPGLGLLLLPVLAAAAVLLRRR